MEVGVDSIWGRRAWRAKLQELWFIGLKELKV